MRPLSSADIATLKPSPSSPSSASPGHADAVERELRGVLGAQPELALHRPRLEALRARRDEERRDPPRALAARAREDDRRLGPGAERDEDLRAGQHPVVAVRRFGPRRQRRGVGAAAGLGERVAAEPLAAREPRQERAASAPRSPTSRPSCRRGRSRPRRSRARTSRPCRAPRRAGSTRPSRARRRRAPPAGPAARKPASASVPTSERGSSSASSQARACGTISRVAELARGLADQLLLGREGEVHENDVGAVAGPHDPCMLRRCAR